MKQDIEEMAKLLYINMSVSNTLFCEYVPLVYDPVDALIHLLVDGVFYS